MRVDTCVAMCNSHFTRTSIVRVTAAIHLPNSIHESAATCCREVSTGRQLRTRKLGKNFAARGAKTRTPANRIGKHCAAGARRH